MFSKRGETESNIELWFLIAAFLLAAFAGLELIRDTINTVQGDTLAMNFISKDLALTLDAVYASPGEVTYIYNMKNHDYFVDFFEGRVQVSKEDGRKSTIYRIFGSGSENLNFETTTKAAEDCEVKLEIKKEQEDVSISALNCGMKIEERTME